MNIFLGLLILAGGVCIMYFSHQIAQLGAIQWAEKHLGSTRSMYILLGFIFVVLGFMVLFGFTSLKSNPQDNTFDTTILN